MVYPAVAAVVGILLVIIYGVKRILNRRQSSGNEADSSHNESRTGKKQPTDQEGTASDVGNSISSTDSANDPSTDRKKKKSGTIPTDVTSQGRVHTLTLSDVKDNGTGVGRFHGLVIMVEPFPDADDAYKIGDDIKVKVTDVANKYATAIPLKKL